VSARRNCLEEAVRDAARFLPSHMEVAGVASGLSPLPELGGVIRYPVLKRPRGHPCEL
jgi:hypothetical protein